MSTKEATATSLSGLAVTRGNLFTIALQDLHEDPDNVRVIYGDIPELAKQLVARGQEHPLKVRMQRLADGAEPVAMVTDGNRRLRAARYAVEKLGWKVEGLKCFSEDRGVKPLERLLSMLAANDGQKPLEPMEEARAYAKLKAGDEAHKVKGLTLQQIADQLGKKRSWVEDRLDLLKAPVEVQEAVEKGQIGVAKALLLAKAPPESLKDALQRAEAEQAARSGDGVATKRGKGAKEVTPKAKAPTTNDLKKLAGKAVTLSRAEVRECIKVARAQEKELDKLGDTEEAACWAAVRWALGVSLGEVEFHTSTRWSDEKAETVTA